MTSIQTIMESKEPLGGQSMDRVMRILSSRSTAPGLKGMIGGSRNLNIGGRFGPSWRPEVSELWVEFRGR